MLPDKIRFGVGCIDTIGNEIRLYRIRREFKRLWKNYLYQSFLATIVVFIVLLLLNMEHAVVIASIGATAFIVFTMPRNITAAPRRVIGGHLIGLFLAHFVL
jgi:CBS-domain-containing membrane protein